jgi:hypothetical protein
MSRTTIELLKEIGRVVKQEFERKVGHKDFTNFQFAFNSNYQTFFATALVDGEEVEHFIEFTELPVYLPKDEPKTYSPFVEVAVPSLSDLDRFHPSLRVKT